MHLLRRLLVARDDGARVSLLLRPAEAVEDFLQNGKVVADADCHLVEEAGRVNRLCIHLYRDLLAAEPLRDGLVLFGRGQCVGVGQVDDIRWCNRHCFGSLLRQGVTGCTLETNPVSYTHLDVYKRQHPFTIASADRGDRIISFQIKALGDYTCLLYTSRCV